MIDDGGRGRIPHGARCERYGKKVGNRSNRDLEVGVRDRTKSDRLGHIRLRVDDDADRASPARPNGNLAEVEVSVSVFEIHRVEERASALDVHHDRTG